MAAHFDVNVILVGADKFTPAQRQQVNDSIQVMTSIYAPLGPTVGTTNRFSISTANSIALDKKGPLHADRRRSGLVGDSSPF